MQNKLTFCKKKHVHFFDLSFVCKFAELLQKKSESSPRETYKNKK